MPESGSDAADDRDVAHWVRWHNGGDPLDPDLGLFDFVGDGSLPASSACA
jgi:hypothetical protein